MADPLTTAAFVITMYAVGCDVKEKHPTKSGVMPALDFTVAADPKILPIGTILHVEGFGERMVQDVGGLVKGKHIDLYVDSCHKARQWGRRTRNVRVISRP